MSTQAEERRTNEQAVIIFVVSRDQVWLHFAEKTLRRTDQVKALQKLEEIGKVIPQIDGKPVLLISSELVPSKVHELKEMIHIDQFRTVCVLRESHDEHQRVNDKHLKDLGIQVSDRPDNAKAFHRTLKIVCN
jgi:hypothetical protein